MGNCVKKQSKVVAPSFAKNLKESAISDGINLNKIQNNFEFLKVIGHGHFGTVRQAQRKTNPGIYFAIKSINKAKVGKHIDLLRAEVELLRIADHPNIINLYEIYEDFKYLHLVMEHCTGGDVLDYFTKNKNLTELEVAQLMTKMLSAVNYLHSNNICHRDLKPENFLLTSQDSSAEVKLIDFGLAKKFEETDLKTFVGTPYYVAPEVIKGKYGKECDVWSLGVILYLFLSGRPPFNGKSQDSIFQKIVEVRLELDLKFWKNISREAKDLVFRMLVARPSKRITASKALRHKWFTSNAQTPKIPTKILQKLRNFKAPKKFQQEAMKVLVKRLNLAEIADLNEAFASLDHTKSGCVFAGDILFALQKSNFPVAFEDMQRIVDSVECLDKAWFNYTDFLLATIDKKKLLNEELLFEAFRNFEENGRITAESLGEAMERIGNPLPASVLKEMISEFDTNQDSQIDFQEFKRMIADCQSLVSSPMNPVQYTNFTSYLELCK